MNDRLLLAVPEGARPGVVWWAPLFNYSGYADEARAFVTGLRERRVELRAEALGEPSPSFVAGLDAERKAALDAAVRAPRPRHAVHVLHVPGEVATRLPWAGYHVARSMFETDSLPPSWVPRLNEMDEIWVPAQFNVDTFRAAGVTVPIHVVPGGVYPEAFAGAEPLAIDGLRGTVFLSVFEWSFRKGWDVLLRAWAKAFSPRDDVTLLLRTYPMKRAAGTANDIERQINTFLNQIGTSRRRVAPIVVLHDHVADADMPRLYATANAYVSPSRGEGWGRPMLEAMAAGLPVIATRWSGNLAFMHDDNSLLLDVEKLEKIDGREEIEFYRGQRWAKPSVSHLAKLLTQVAADPGAAAALGRRAQAEVAQRWTWDAGVAAAEARLAEIDARMRRAAPKPDAVPVRWVGEQYSWHSLAHVNRELCRRLQAGAAVELELETREHALRRTLHGDAVADLEARTGEVLSRPPRVEVRHQWPPDWNAPRQGAWVAVQPWEFGGLPDDWVQPLVEQVDEVWCYTSYVRDCYVTSGVPVERVRVIPLGVDSERFSPDGDAYPLRTRKTTKLLFVGGAIARKGIDVLLDAYTATFTPADDVCLVLKTFGASSVYRHNSEDARIAALAADPVMPEIELITDELSPDAMAALYRACGALVHPYRGEGFGLPIAEAMACGLPVVVTNHGAALDFCDAENAYLIPATVVPVPADGLAPNTAGHWWAEPDPVTLRALLRDVVASPDDAKAKGARGRERVVRDLSWDAAAHAVEERLVALADITPLRFRADRPTFHAATGFVATAVPRLNRDQNAEVLLSACMIVRDEADNLPSCLAAIQGVVDEVVIYDTGSVDDTVAIARRAGAVVVEGTWNEDFATARNAALDACTGEWILWVDADETLRGKGADLRAALAKNPPVDVIRIAIDNLDGAGAAVGYSHEAPRVFRRSAGHWEGRLHERVVPRAGKAALRDGFTSDVRLLHTGYRDDAIAAKGKSERNIRIAEAELADGTSKRSLTLIHLGRSLGSAGRLEDALARFEEGLALTDDPAERRLALRHGAEALLDTDQPARALDWIARLRAQSTRTDMVDYLEALAHAALGETDRAMQTLACLTYVRDDDGFVIPHHVLRLRRALVLRGAQRWSEAADELLAIISTDVFPPWGLLAETNWRAVRNADEVAGVISPGQLMVALGQLLQIEPQAADGVVEALLGRWPDDAAVLACAVELAPRLSIERALEWSARLRHAGLADHCPLRAIADDAARSAVERVQAACLLEGAFTDSGAHAAARAIAEVVTADDIVDALVQMGELAPQLLPEFVMAAAGDARRSLMVARALHALGATEEAATVLHEGLARDPDAGVAAEARDWLAEIGRDAAVLTTT